MSIGFPIRARRSSFGVTREDRAATLNPKHAFGARYANLVFWQTAGCNVTNPLAWVLVTSAGTRSASGEAWNSEGDDTLRPTCAKSSTGVYTVTFAATYADMDGDQQAFTPTSASVSVNSTTAGMIAVWSISGSVVTVKTSDAAGTLTDAGFHLSVW